MLLMLEMMRQNSRSTIIYVLFGIVIATFIVNFGPGSRASCSGPGVMNAAVVGGYTLGEGEFRNGVSWLSGFGQHAQYAKERRLNEFVMDKLIERELLAQEAERLGLRVSEADVEDMLVGGRFLVLGMRQRITNIVFKNGAYDHDRFSTNFVRYMLHSTVKKVIEEQRRELLAERLRELLRTSTPVSANEVKEDWLAKQTQLNVQFVRFVAAASKGDEEISAAEVDKYLAAHKDKVKEHYEQRSFYYKNMPRELKLRQILVEDQKKADEIAKATKDKPADFDKLVAAKSEDPATKSKQGLLGWRRKGALALESGEDDLFKATAGQVVGPFKAKRGYLVLKVEDVREGNVPVEKVERELAEDLAKRDRSLDKARKDAESYLAKLKSGKTFDALFPKQKSSDDGDDKARSFAADAPTLQETGLFSRRGDVIPEIGIAKDLAKQVWKLKVGEPSGPFETSGAIVLVAVKEKKDAKPEEFDKKKAELTADFADTRWKEALDDWSKKRCAEARDAGQIRVNADMLRYEKNDEKVAYTPCAPAVGSAI